MSPLLAKGAPPAQLSPSKSTKGKRKNANSEDEDDEDDKVSEMSEDERRISEPEEDDGIEHTTTISEIWKPAPARQGSILVTLRDCKPYTLWSVHSIANTLLGSYALYLLS